MRVVGGLLIACLTVALLPASQAGDGGPDDLLAKAIKAAGGKDKVAKLQAGTCKGKLTFSEGGQDIMITMDLSWQGMKQFKIEAEVQVGGMVNNGVVVINGDKAWMKEGDKVRELPNEIAPLLRGALYAVRLPHMLVDMQSKDFKLSVIGEVKVGERPAISVSVAHKDQKDATFYFDKENGLPVKSEIRVMDPNGRELAFEYTYSDYKEADGLKHCTRVGLKIDGKDLTIELSEIRPQGTLDAATFAEPK